MSDSMQSEQSDFFDSSYKQYQGKWRGKRLGTVKDIVFDACLLMKPSYLTLASRAARYPKRTILIVGVEVPARSQELKDIMQALSRSHHHVTTKLAPLGEGRGKFHNINLALEGVKIDDYDWLIIVDDDITFAEGFLDKFIYLSERAGMMICQPAHKFRSYQSFELTLRQLGSLARITHYVESGPFTAFRHPILPYVLPFPPLRWAWGTDIVWSEIARKHNFPIGIIDATPIRHLKPVAVSYDTKLAMEEARKLLVEARVTRKRPEILQTTQTISRI